MLLPLLGLAGAVSAQTTVSISVNLAGARTAISPRIYGINDPLDVRDRYGALRQGGNRLTSYNWENNASNAGIDYINHSDNYLCVTGGLSAANCLLPATVVSAFWQQAQTYGAPFTLTTLPIAGYVAADKLGTVDAADAAPSGRWKQVVARKGSAFSLTPDATDGYVYADELVNLLKTKHGAANAGGITAYSIDNEPGLWKQSHPYLHPAKAGVMEVWTKSRDLARAVKDVDPTAQVFGPALYGFQDYLNLQNAPDWSAQKGTASWFIDYYLAKLQAASVADGRRLLDALDLHWYPEAQGTVRITLPEATSAADQTARLQAPRTLWDPNYTENSWIGQYYSARLPLLPKLLSSINTQYPGTKLSFSEYCYGGCADYSGGLAQADVLGIFGRYGVDCATWWSLCSGSKAYISAAFRLYTNYDGANARYGTLSLPATTADDAATSVYAALESASSDRLHLILLNKTAAPINAALSLTGGTTAYGSATAWGFDQTTTTVSTRASVPSIRRNRFTYPLPAYSATHLVLVTNPLPVELTSFTGQVTPTGHVLTWQTASAANLTTFTVARSADGLTFDSVYAVPAVNGPAPHTYTWTDAAPAPGPTYYRLQSREQNGLISTAPVLALRAPAPTAPNAAPTLTATVTPTLLTAAETPVVRLYNTVPQTVQLVVVDALGRELLHRALGPVPVGATEVPWPELRTVGAGVRILRIIGTTGPTDAVRLLAE